MWIDLTLFLPSLVLLLLYSTVGVQKQFTWLRWQRIKLQKIGWWKAHFHIENWKYHSNYKTCCKDHTNKSQRKHKWVVKSNKEYYNDHRLRTCLMRTTFTSEPPSLMEQNFYYITPVPKSCPRFNKFTQKSGQITIEIINLVPFSCHWENDLLS